MQPATILLLLSCFLGTACHRGPIVPLAPLDVASRDPIHEHLKMASCYALEATWSRHKAEESANRVLVYERLFGRESDWVAGAQLLAQFYEDAAREQDRQAVLHLELAHKR
jgi:hypothetical protein